MLWFAGRRIRDARRALREGAAGENVIAAAGVLLDAAGIGPGKDAPLRVGPAIARRAVEEYLTVPLPRRAFLFEHTLLIRRLGLSAAGIRPAGDRLSIAVVGPAGSLRVSLNCTLIARSVIYLVVDLLPGVQQIDFALFAPPSAGDPPACFFSASTSRSRLRVMNPLLLTPAQLARVMNARTAQVTDQGVTPAEPHVPWAP